MCWRLFLLNISMLWMLGFHTVYAQDRFRKCTDYLQASGYKAQIQAYRLLWETYSKPYSVDKERQLTDDLQIAVQQGNQQQLIVLKSIYATLLGVKGLFEQSNTLTEEVLSAITPQTHPHLYNKMLLTRGLNAIKKLRYDQSNRDFTEVRDRSIASGNIDDQFSAEIALLSGFFLVRQPDKALAEIDRIRALIQKEDSIHYTPRLYRMMSTCYMLKALNGDTEAKHLMLEYAERCEKASLQGDDLMTLFGNYLALGTYYTGIEKNLDKANWYLQKAIQAGLSNGSLREVYMAYNFLIQNSIKANDLNKAEEYAKAALEISRGMDIEDFQMERYYSLAGIYLKKREDDKVMAMIDSIRSTTIVSYNKRYDVKYAELQTRYETAEKEKTISQLDKENALRKLIIAQQLSTLKQQTLDELKRKNEIDLLNKDKVLLNQQNDLLSKDNELNRTVLRLREAQIRKERADKALQQIQIEKLKATQRYERLRNWFVYALSATAIIALSLIFIWLRNKQKQKSLLEKQRYEVQLLESKLSIYSAQMNPHFMFNSMNAVNHFILNNNAMEASRYLTKYARLMRMVLDNSRQLKISLDRELQTLKEYLDLERLRFSDGFFYNIQIDPDLPLEEIEVPPLLLQPFAENAVCHGFLHKDGPGQLSIQIRRQNGWVECVLEDNGVGRSYASAKKAHQKTEHQSAGIDITQNRLKVALAENAPEKAVTYIDKVSPDGQALGTIVIVQLMPWKDNV